MNVAEERDQQLKDAQADDWRRGAEVRLARAALIERHWGAITTRLLALTAVKVGDRVLDVGTGHGEPAITAARTVGPEGRVVAVDLSPEMIAVAQQRAELEGVRGVEWVVQDAEALGFTVDTFDVAVSRNCLMFLPHPERAVSRIHDLLVPGGRFALAVVGPEPTQPQWTMTVTAIVEALGATAPPPGKVGEPGVYSLSDAKLLATLLRDAGFDHVEVRAEELVYDFSSPEEVVTWHSINPTIVGLFAGQSEGQQLKAWQAVVEAAAARADSDGHVRIPSQILYACGSRKRMGG